MAIDLVGVGCIGAALLLVILGLVLVVAWYLTRPRAVPTEVAPRLPRGLDESETETGPRCSACGGALSADTLEGLCPRCLLQDAIRPGSGPPPLPASTAPYRPEVAVPAPAELAQAFPQLEIIELLGKGGMGAVYLARQLKLDRLVALKILPPEVAADPAFAQRFAREAVALARLNHPNIVTVFDFGESSGQYFLLMEYVDGVNLRQAMRAGQLTPEEALRIVPQLCEALQYAHDEGVVHRDIKPENILLDKRGRVKVADFGLAKLLGQSAADSGLTGTQQVMGTLHYMAPEQLAGARSVDHRADIYSLGVTFYEMLTGQLPLGRFPPPSRTVGIDPRLDEIVLRTLEHEPAERYQHASDIKDEVESLAYLKPPGNIAAREVFAASDYSLRVVRPMVVAAGIYVFLVVATVLLGGTWLGAMVVLGGGGIVLLAVLTLLHVAWLQRRRVGSRVGPRDIWTAAPPRSDWPTWWRAKPGALRQSMRVLLLLAVIGFGIGFLSYEERQDQIHHDGRRTTVTIGLLQPWFVKHMQENGGFDMTANFLTASAGFGVLALLAIQALLVLRRWDRVPAADARPVTVRRPPASALRTYGLWVGLPMFGLAAVLIGILLASAGRPLSDSAAMAAIILFVICFIMLNLVWALFGVPPRVRSPEVTDAHANPEATDRT
jgi:predicted Ser/Thr protein kinase